MLMKQLMSITTKIKNNIIFMIVVYSIIIIACIYIFLYKPLPKVDFIYNGF